MMKATLVTVGVVMAVAATLGADIYSTNFNIADLDNVLNNDRLLKAYADCLLDRGSCTPEAAAIKRVLPEALKTGCAKCTKQQKEGGIKVIKFLVEKKPELWKEIANKYDPTGFYAKTYAPKY